MNITAKLNKIQQALKAPKGQYNKFGGYEYRSAEDILEAVKPLMGDLVLTLNDDVILVGDRYYVKATVSISDGEQTISTVGFAREAQDKKGMDESQITGACSSYARKYALNGLFCIDDAKDSDITNTHGCNSEKVVKTKSEVKNVDKKNVEPPKETLPIKKEGLHPSSEQAKTELRRLRTPIKVEEVSKDLTNKPIQDSNESWD